MAKWGEGDPRWIVEERPDATNCGNWHWVEKDATQWSQNRLKELILGQTLRKGPIKILFKDFKKLEGDASANNRKAKLIFFFEWAILIEFEATIDDSELTYNGTIDILNLSDENEASEIQISAQVEKTGPHENGILSLIYSDGLSLIREQLNKYILGLKEEFSNGLILPTDQARPQAVSKGKTSFVDKRDFQNSVVGDQKEDKATKPAKTEELADFDLVETFKLPPDRLYEILTKPELVAAWCPNSSLEPRAGGNFSLLGGIISGQFCGLVEDKEISMNWRLKSYPPGVFAKIKMTLNDKGDSCDLQVQAKGVPKSLLEESKTGFTRYYFQHIGHRFGCTLKMF